MDSLHKIKICGIDKSKFDDYVDDFIGHFKEFERLILPYNSDQMLSKKHKIRSLIKMWCEDQDNVLECEFHPTLGVFTILAQKNKIPSLQKDLAKLQLDNLPQEMQHLGIDMSGEKYCPICMDSLDQSRISLSGCGHQFCKMCFRAYFVNCIRDISKTPIKCPDIQCTTFIAADDLKIIDHSNLAILAKFGGNIFVQANSYKYTACPTPDCDGIIILSKVHRESPKKQFECEVCRNSYCFLCKQKAHPRRLCNSSLKDKDKALVLKKELQNGCRQCPKCKFLITKIDGCNHVICALCKTHICWFTNCTMHFETANKCYAHMHQIHHNIS